MSKRKKCLISCMICILILGCIIGFSGVKKASKGSMNAEDCIRVQNDTQYIQYAYTVKNIDGKDYATNVYIQGVYSDQKSDPSDRVALTTDVVVPNELNGYPVYSIGDGGYCNNITDYSDGFFKDTKIKALLNVDLSNCKSLYRLNDGCFVDKSYVVVVVPKNVKFVGKNCFSYTSEMTVKCQNPNICFEGEATNVSNSFKFETYANSTAKEFYGNRAKIAYGNEDSVVKFTLGCSVDSNFSQENVLNTYAWVVMDDESMADTATVNVPVLQHRDFQGYFTEPDGKGTQIFDSEGKLVFKNLDQTKFTGSVELYAYHTLREAEITFHKNLKGSKDTEVHTAVYSCDFPKTSFSETGYTLKSWNTKSDGSGETIALSGITDIDNVERGSNNAIKTLYAQWSANRYKVTLNDELGETINTIDIYVTFGQPYSDSSFYKPTKTGYTFLGWYTEDGTEIKESDLVTIARDHILNAKWSKNVYCLTLNANNGSTETDKIKISYDKSEKVIECPFKKIGYHFVGWSCDKQGSNPFTKVSKVTKDQTLYAVWKPNEYNATFIANNTSSSKAAEYEQSLYNNENDTDKYSFAGWTVGSKEVYRTLDDQNNGKSEPTYKKGDAIPYEFTNDVTFVAVWNLKPSITIDSEDKVTVKINQTKSLEGEECLYCSNGFSITSIKSSIDDFKTITSISLNTASGKVIGSSDGSDLKGTWLLNKSNDKKENYVIKIVTTPNVYSIYYGVDFDGPFASTYEYGKGLSALPTNVTCTQNGMKFSYWEDMATGERTDSIPKAAHRDYYLLAHFDTIKYTINTDLDGGAFRVNGKKIPSYCYKFNEKITLTNEVLKTGYTFVGWYCQETNNLITQIDPSKCQNWNIKAIWKSKAYLTQTDYQVALNNDSASDRLLLSADTNNKLYYYGTLTSIEKQIYTTICSSYLNSNTLCPIDTLRLKSKTEFTRENVLNACYAVILDHPELFWINAFSVSTVAQRSDGGYICIVVPQETYDIGSCRADAKEYDNNFSVVKTALDKNGINKKKSFYDKLKIIYQYIAKTYSYRTGSRIMSADTDDETRAVGYMLSHKEGCCVSYAKMVQLLCNQYGIPCVLVHSDTHMWNEIKMENGKWYLLDATWDDNGSSASNNYFLKGSNVIKDDKDHTVRKSYFNDSSGNPITTFVTYDIPQIEKNAYDNNVISKSKKTNRVSKKGVTYTISGKNAVVSKVTNKKLKKATVLAKVKIGKKTYKVVGINKNVFKGCKKLKSVTIKSTTLKQIGSNAFKGCKNLKKITIKSKKIKKIGKNAFKGIHKKAVFKVPKKQKKKYTKLLKKAGLKKTMKVK